MLCTYMLVSCRVVTSMLRERRCQLSNMSENALWIRLEINRAVGDISILFTTQLATLAKNDVRQKAWRWKKKNAGSQNKGRNVWQ